jgi:hypothetical protein
MPWRAIGSWMSSQSGSSFATLKIGEAASSRWPALAICSSTTPSMGEAISTALPSPLPDCSRTMAASLMPARRSTWRRSV